MQVVDLLAPMPQSAGTQPTQEGQRLRVNTIPGLTLEHTCLKVETLVDLDLCLATARTRSCNWGPSPENSATLTALPNRAHAFLRVALHNRKTGWLSFLHVVDLAGELAVDYY